ncbi:MAG TPA: UDP-forming cellulose synthase catalytic subunit [Acetobacteraceae bacterium]|nr:UDP-forming cellulose synthase catalytic subunit [Acetobacteraceae bacterium]
MRATPLRADRARPTRPDLVGRATQALLILAGAALLLAVASVPLGAGQQALLAVFCAATFLIANRFRGRFVSVCLIVLSLGVSLRYIVWRLTQTLEFGTLPELVLGGTLVAAEMYAVTVLVLGYVQTIWPLQRKPVPLPPDPAGWPTVDVFIPTYNEALSVVRATVLAATGIDWPSDKLRVHLLDDGKREEFRRFAQAAGVNYITRPDNRHAKAGNLNHALTRTDGEFILVFDCDHIPTRAFLQFTMGWLVREKKLAMVQTPHHFYSPDPFQRNLAAGTRVPPEGNLFYGLIQDGNDFWNASFFCGSCAVIRRAALATIGGYAVETVTEDAHTMLKLHRAGWDSAYLAIPLAAGLATERLILHIGQRMRWARGMIQIFRIDNPLLGPGLTLPQRICYLQAMGHFFFAVPRIVFLTSPLMYLLLGQNIIAASPLAIVAYALPHIFHSVATNSRLQGHWRHSFWSEIYETVLALFLVRVTINTLISPRRGKFNVTDKGGLLENGYFDLGAVYPNIILAVVLVLGIGRGIGQILLVHNDALTFQALLLNSIWALFSLLTVMAALAVGRETRQMRNRARIRAALSVVIYLPDGRLITGTTRDLSQGGGRLLAARPEGLADDAALEIEFQLAGQVLLVPAQAVRWQGDRLQVEFRPRTMAEEAATVQAVFARADAWADWADYPKDRPLASLWRVLVSIRGLFRPRDRLSAAPPRPDRQPGEAPLPPALPERAVGLARRAAALGLVALLAGAGAARASQGAAAADPASHAMTVRPVPTPVVELQDVPMPPAPPTPGATAPAPAAPGTAPPAAPPAIAAPGAVPPVQTGSAATAPAAGERRVVLPLRRLGAMGPLTLRGSSPLQGVQFGIRADEVVTGAELSLNGANSPALLPAFSNVTVTLNEQYVGTIPVNRDQPRYDHLVMPIDPAFFQEDNRLNFRFTGRYTAGCNDPLSGLLWSTVSDGSTLTLTLARLPPQRDLSRLPLPFFDAHDRQRLRLPFVLPPEASDQTLQGAAIVASWFGGLADYRGARFPAANSAPAEGNAVVFATASEHPGGLTLPPLDGPTLAEIANPNDPAGSLLLVAGRTGEELVQAAQALAAGGARLLGGDHAVVAAPDLPERVPYDAPAWIPSDRPVRFGELVDAAALQGVGYAPGTMRVPFRTAPDLYTWRGAGFPLHVRFRAPPGPIVDLAASRLDVSINNLFLGATPLADRPSLIGAWLARWTGDDPDVGAARFSIPPYDVFGQNDLQFFFDTRPLHRGDCRAVPEDLHMAVDPDSTVDLSRAWRFAEMPNLAFFVNSGFPFTRMADLSQTAAVLPERPDAAEISTFFDLMGQIGAFTGYPVMRIAVIRPGEAASMADRDLLLIGTLPHLADAAPLLRGSPVQLQNGVLRVALGHRLPSVYRLFDDAEARSVSQARAQVLAVAGGDGALLVGAQSPLHAGRSLVAVLGMTPPGLADAVAVMANSTQAPHIQGDLAVLSGGRATSWRVGDSYTVGSLPFWVWPSWALRNDPLGLLLWLVGGTLLLAFAFFRTLRRLAQRRAGGH